MQLRTYLESMYKRSMKAEVELIWVDYVDLLPRLCQCQAVREFRKVLTTAQPMAIMPNIQYRLTGGIDCINSSNLGILRFN